MYSNDIGRFLQRDPVGDANLYQYTDNDPLNRTDPLGLYGYVELIYNQLGGAGNVYHVGLLVFLNGTYYTINGWPSPGGAYLWAFEQISGSLQAALDPLIPAAGGHVQFVAGPIVYNTLFAGPDSDETIGALLNMAADLIANLNNDTVPYMAAPVQAGYYTSNELPSTLLTAAGIGGVPNVSQFGPLFDALSSPLGLAPYFDNQHFLPFSLLSQFGIQNDRPSPNPGGATGGGGFIIGGGSSTSGNGYEWGNGYGWGNYDGWGNGYGWGSDPSFGWGNGRAWGNCAWG